MGKLFRAVMLCALVVGLRAAEPAWTTDVATAKAQAQKENKAILLDFTGSDWCPPCKNLKKTVFDSSQFQEYAGKKLVLVEVDFPKGKAQPDGLKKQNERLSQQYKVEAFPTIIFLDPSGKELGRTEGYSGESVSTYISRVDKFVARVKAPAAK